MFDLKAKRYVQYDFQSFLTNGQSDLSGVTIELGSCNELP
jgi:hypothetical protein